MRTSNRSITRLTGASLDGDPRRLWAGGGEAVVTGAADSVAAGTVPPPSPRPGRAALTVGGSPGSSRSATSARNG